MTSLRTPADLAAIREIERRSPLSIADLAECLVQVPALCSALEQAWERIRELEKAISEYLRASEYTPANPLTQDQWEALANTVVPARPVKDGGEE